jgi:hypothetical protein
MSLLKAGKMRAEEIVIELWRQLCALRSCGVSPGRIILSPENYRQVQAWHIALGELENPERDYISRHSIFGLPVFIDAGISLKVE